MSHFARRVEFADSLRATDGGSWKVKLNLGFKWLEDKGQMTGDSDRGQVTQMEDK